MIFGKKENKKCENCGKNTIESSNFCPNCGSSFTNAKKEMNDFGLLGKNDFTDQPNFLPQNLGVTDKLFNSIFNSLMKNLDKQFQSQFKDLEKNLENAEIKTFPNGIRIKISSPQMQKQKEKRVVSKSPSEETMRKMSSLPREQAKSNMKRIGDKIIYEFTTPGITSPEDVFVSKLESGYEIKVVGNKKVYINNVPLNLPLKRYTIQKNKLSVEFNALEN